MSTLRFLEVVFCDTVFDHQGNNSNNNKCV